ncbi:hypothetical protein AvCA_13330 [Azotobacter vinelandii CA]|uniref:Uncharacterized protein n=2 Tax=Azotobacter vinelandii TaxID=354 RepID=C1DQA7_AZOVD|nr:hypothetical protein Avin_13330 [Azotobacter vinelandii DJ]AGK17026.1 hypothetical protein AvCA_13330 [Azotobacter vinelandii CA]AGK19857.1 hypothetical protein AvCA6_13330 [Azotobacter vinelandii CA6]
MGKRHSTRKLARQEKRHHAAGLSTARSAKATRQTQDCPKPAPCDRTSNEHGFCYHGQPHPPANNHDLSSLAGPPLRCAAARIQTAQVAVRPGAAIGPAPAPAGQSVTACRAWALPRSILA